MKNTYRATVETLQASYADNEYNSLADALPEGITPEQLSMLLGISEADWSWIDIVITNHEMTSYGDGHLFC